MKLLGSALLLVDLIDAFSLRNGSPRLARLSTRTSAPNDATRRSFVFAGLVPAVLTLRPFQATALVKGSAPPPKKIKSERSKCTSIEECESIGEKRSEELFADSEDEENLKKTSAGDIFKDIVVGTGKVVGPGSQVLHTLSRSVTTIQLGLFTVTASTAI